MEHYNTFIEASAPEAGCDTDELDDIISFLLSRYVIHRAFVQSLDMAFGRRDPHIEALIRSQKGWCLELRAWVTSDTLPNAGDSAMTIWAPDSRRSRRKTI